MKDKIKETNDQDFDLRLLFMEVKLNKGHLMSEVVVIKHFIVFAITLILHLNLYSIITIFQFQITSFMLFHVGLI